MGLTVGIDVGGTKIAGGVVNEHGTILATARRDARHDLASERIAVLECLAPVRVDPAGSGAGVLAGPGTARGGRVLRGELARSLRDEPVLIGQALRCEHGRRITWLEQP